MATKYIFILGFLLLMGCRHTPDLTGVPLVTYDAQVQPIILNNCTGSGCHDSNSRKKALTTYSQTMAYVSAGKPYKSKLFKSIIKLTGDDKMPPNNTLTDDQINTIYIWILQGTQEK